jgi:hypothetical protein
MFAIAGGLTLFFFIICPIVLGIIRLIKEPINAETKATSNAIWVEKKAIQKAANKEFRRKMQPFSYIVWSVFLCGFLFLVVTAHR